MCIYWYFRSSFLVSQFILANIKCLHFFLTWNLLYGTFWSKSNPLILLGVVWKTMSSSWGNWSRSWSPLLPLIPPCLCLLRLMQQSTIDWMAYKLQKCISQSSGGWKSEIMCQHGWVLGRALFGPTDCWLLISTSILIWWKESRPTLWSLLKGH